MEIINKLVSYSSNLTNEDLVRLARENPSELMERMKFMGPGGLVAAIDALAYRGPGNAQIEKLLIGLLYNDNCVVRERAARSLIAFASESVLLQLINVCEHDLDNSVRNVAHQTSGLIAAILDARHEDC